MIQDLFKVTLSTHNFTITRLTPRAKTVVLEFAKRSIQYGLVRVPGGRYIHAAVRVYGCATASREEFRFHINQFEEFKEHLANNFITDKLYSVDKKHVPVPVKIDIDVKDIWKPREHQLGVIDYVLAKDDIRSKLISMQTGQGKSFVSLYCIKYLAMRTVIILKAMYIDKWIEDVKKTYDINPKDIMVVKGGAQLQDLIIMARNGELTSKFIIIGNKCLQNWYKLYELMGANSLDMGYDCLPEDFFETIGAGIRLIDEVHQDFHLNFKIDLYTNIEQVISLSATLINNDQFMVKMYEVAYPLNERYKNGELKRYVKATAVQYKLNDKTFLSTTEWGSTTYSHHAFEKSLSRDPRALNNFFKLIESIVEDGYLKDYVPGQKCLIFCAGIDFCTLVTAFLKKIYPQFSINRYVEDDPYSNLLESDISVSTLQSAGTAHDINNLKTVILTVGVDSIQANVQSLGRLRDLVIYNTYFYYFFCQDIQKQVDYHNRKEKMLRERAASFRIMNAKYFI
jgi:superfamily II DNA or RNA helicase